MFASLRRPSLRALRAAFADPFLWLTLLLSLPAVGPLLQPGYMWGAHDARHSVYFLFQFDKAIRDGIWYPRWAPDFAFGFGYPFFNIYGPLSSYAGELFLFAGLDYVAAVKVVFGLSAALSGLTMFLFVRRLLGSRAGLAAGLVYVYFPYHLFDLYARAALAESVGIVFIPLVLWAFYESVTRPTLRRIIWGGAAYAGLMFTHSAMTLMLTPILGLYVLAMLAAARPRPFSAGGVIRRAIPPAAMLAAGLSLSAIFLLPALAETQYVRVDQWVGGRYAFGTDFVEVFQLFSPHWGFGASIPGPNDDAAFQIGLVPLVLFALSFGAAPRLKNRAQRLTLYFLQGLVIVIAFLTTPLSAWVWQIIPLSRFAQFPWRLLALLAPAVAVAGGTVAQTQNSPEETPAANRQSLAAILPLVLLILLSGFPYLRAEIRDPKPTEGPVSLAGLFRFQQSADEMTGSTVWVKQIPAWSPLADVVIGGGEITSRVVQTEAWDESGTVPLLGVDSWGDVDSVHETVWVYAADDRQTVTFYIPYYPGWTATIYEDLAPNRPDLYPNGRIGRAIGRPEIQTTDPQGWMVIPVPAGSHFLELRFEDTPVRVAGKWLSALTLGLMGAGLVAGQKTKWRGA